MNVNTAQVAQERLEKLIEAAGAYRRAVDEYMECHSGVNAGKIVTADKVLHAAIAEARKPGALAAPEPEGDVVERAALIARDAYQRGMWQGAFKDTMTMDGWRAVAEALSAAGLLARPVDRERLANVAKAEFQRALWATNRADSTNHEIWQMVADAILREVGR